MTYIVALTGGIGSGKSTVANAFARHGIQVIDADIIARQVVAPGMPVLAAIHQRYGAGILLADGSLNRTALRQHIFSQADERRWLDGLLHPLIHAETQRQFAQSTTAYLLWVVPLLVENNLQQRADRVLVIDIDRETQLARTMARDGVTRQQAENILAAQATQAQRLACADDIIDNRGSPENIESRVAELHHRYLELATSARQQD